MNGVTEITATKWEARQKYQEYRHALVSHPLPYLRDLKDAYNQLRKGHGIIDAFKAFKQAGVNADGEPRLAIYEADGNVCHFHKGDEGSGYFGFGRNSWRRKNILELRAGTFPIWPTEPSPWNPEHAVIKREDINCKVPVVPAHLLPKADLHNFHILWEVEKWDAEPPHDPLLLRRVSINLFAVVARWDLTELERAVIAGRIR